MRVLIADDREDVRIALELLLKGAGHRSDGAASPAEVRQALTFAHFDALLLDLNYTRDTTSGQEGLALVRELQRTQPALPLIAMTAWGSVELAVEAMREGARDFVLKPWDGEKLLRTLERHGRPRPEGVDLQRAGRVQARFRSLSAPAGGSLECAGACDEAGTVGGDVFDVLDLAPGHLGLLVGDASGRGVSGALLVAYLQAAIRTQSSRAVGDLAGFVGSVNRVFYDRTAPEHFATLFFAVWDEAVSQLRYVNCGHPAPVVLRADGGTVERLQPTGSALGLFEEARPSVAEVALRPGDVVAGFTDGVAEAQGAGGDFGEERIVSALVRARELPLADLPATLLAEVAAFVGEDAEEKDDRAVLVARVRAGGRSMTGRPR